MTFPRRTPPIPPDVQLNHNPAPTLLGMLMSLAGCASGVEIIAIGCLIALAVLILTMLCSFLVSVIDRSKKH